MTTRQTQPVRVAPGGEHGTRQELEALQGAAPLAVDQPLLGSAGGGGGAAASPPRSAFAPTDRPNQPATAGLPSAGPSGLSDPDMLLRIMYQMTGDPYLLRLLRS